MGKLDSEDSNSENDRPRERAFTDNRITVDNYF